MEFRYRAGDRREAPPPPPQLEFAFASHPLLHPMAAAALRREMLKQQIRDEILAREAAERREIEEEVRHEIDMEREMLKQQIRDEIIAREAAERRKIEEEVRHELDMERAMPVFLRAHPSPTISQLTQVNESQPSLARIKRKGGAVEGSNKVARAGEPTKVAPASERNLHCALCEVSTTSEEGLKEHLNGNKHQANVTSLSCKGTVSKEKRHDANVASLSSKGTGTRVSSGFVTERKNVSSSDSTPKVSATSLEEDADHETKRLTMIVNGKRHEVLKKDKLFWCELCSVKCSCTELMAGHLGGKKHIAREGEANARKSDNKGIED